MRKGVTLVELIISIAVIAILASITLPVSRTAVKRRDEMLLKKHLNKIRDAIDYHYDIKHNENSKLEESKKYPENIDKLLSDRLLREIPMDPITQKREWKYIPRVDGENNLWDVKSMSDKKALNGSNYNEW